MVHEAVIILPTHLFQQHPLLSKDKHIYLIECERYFSDFMYHQQKLVLHRATMKMYYQFLLDAGYRVKYIDHPGLQAFEHMLRTDKTAVFHVCDPVDHGLTDTLKKICTKHKRELHIHESPSFLTTRDEVRTYFSGKTIVRHHVFYTMQRKRLHILVHDGSPVGGAWSFDTENRKPLGARVVEIDRYEPRHNEYVTEAIAYVTQRFSDHPGRADTFWLPTTFATAKKWLQDFFQHRFINFGPYQDAIKHDDPFLFHAVISPLLNIGLLMPTYVVDQALAYAHEHRVPLATLEGFVRQIIGWREYVRGVYESIGEKQRASNYFNHSRVLHEGYWNGSTGILPLDDAIKQVVEYSYVHHIVRLMVLGTGMLLHQIDPHEVYRWFMELFIDAYDWVMVPNVYGMSQYADGGLMTTKPYICSSQYIMRMSDYKKDTWCTTWDALYWYFIYQHQAVLKHNYRLASMVSMLKRMSPSKLQQHIACAKRVLAHKE